MIAERTESYNLEITPSALKCEVILRMEKWLVGIYMVKTLKVGVYAKCVHFDRLSCYSIYRFKYLVMWVK